MAKRAASRRRVQTAKPHLVFVSHATYDKFLAKVLCEKLESSVVGAATFRDDRDIDGGDSIPETIKAKIRECDELLILLTPESIQHDWIKLEIGMAEILDKRIIPLLYHVDPEVIPGILRDKRAFRLDEIDDYLQIVSKRVRGS